MNREIKFRALRADSKGWVYGDLLCNWTIPQILSEDDGNEYKVIPESVGQFTGLKDQNGVDIYEGDICSGHCDGNGVITWTDFDGGYDYVFKDESNVGIWEVKNNIQIIGDIHENPELLCQ